MNKLKLLFLLVCLGIITASPALSAQIAGKALSDVDDIVKEATHGNLEIPKHSIMLLKAGELNGNNSYLQTNIMTLNSAGQTTTKSLQVLNDQGEIIDPADYYIHTVPIMNLTPVFSRKSYNGKRIVMWNTTNKNSFKTYFAALQNNRADGGAANYNNPFELVNALSTSLIGNPYET